MKYLHSLKNQAILALTCCYKIDWTNMLHIYEKEKNLVNIFYHLKRFVLDIHILDFCEEIYKTKSIISGSFLLQCYYNEVFDNSDLDIFTTDINLLVNLYSVQNPHIDYSFDYQQDFYVYNDNKVQIIIINNGFWKTSIDYIVETFDIDICSMTFDGYTLYIPPEIENNLNERKMCAIRLKRNTINRIKKYQRRNFELRNDKSYIKEFKNVKYIRPCKYQQLSNISKHLFSFDKNVLTLIKDTHLTIDQYTSSLTPKRHIPKIITTDDCSYIMMRSRDEFIINGTYTLLVMINISMINQTSTTFFTWSILDKIYIDSCKK